MAKIAAEASCGVRATAARKGTRLLLTAHRATKLGGSGVLQEVAEAAVRIGLGASQTLTGDESAAAALPGAHAYSAAEGGASEARVSRG